MVFDIAAFKFARGLSNKFIDCQLVPIEDEVEARRYNAMSVEELECELLFWWLLIFNIPAEYEDNDTELEIDAGVFTMAAKLVKGWLQNNDLVDMAADNRINNS